MTDRERRLEIVAKQLVKYFGALEPGDYALAMHERLPTMIWINHD